MKGEWIHVEDRVWVVGLEGTAGLVTRVYQSRGQSANTVDRPLMERFLEKALHSG